MFSLFGAIGGQASQALAWALQLLLWGALLHASEDLR